MERSPVRSSPNGTQLHVWVVLGASSPGLAGVHGDKLKVRVAAPPERGRANEESTRLLESALGIEIELVAGMFGRHEVFEVAARDPELVCRKLGLSG